MAGLTAHSVLVTGSTRGIGLGLVKHSLGKPNPPEWIFAACRDPEGTRVEEIMNLAAKHPNLVLVPLEATDPMSIQATAKKAEAHLGGSGLNLLINNAGVMPESTLESATAADMLAVYKINLVGPMLVTQAELMVEDSVQGILKVLSILSEKHHGIVVDWTGRNVPW